MCSKRKKFSGSLGDRETGCPYQVSKREGIPALESVDAEMSRPISRYVAFYLALVLMLVVPVEAGAVIVDGVAAVVNGQPILISALNEALSPYRQEFAEQYQGHELELKVRAAARTLLRELVDQEVMLHEAERLGLSVTAKSIDEGVEDVKGRFASEEQFRAALAEAGDKEADVRDEIMRSLLLRKLIAAKRREFMDDVSVTEQEVLENLETTGKIALTQKQIELWQIFIAAPPEGTEKERAEARKRAEDVLDRLRAGADFEETAREVSDGPARDSGGLMGMMRRGDMQADLEAAAFSIEPGGISEVVEGPTGFHIFRVSRVEEPDHAAIAAIMEDSELAVRASKVQKKYEQWLSGLREKADIRIEAYRSGT